MDKAGTPELLCIGFLCHDLHNGNYHLGGTASYSGIMAKHLGLQTAILTSVGDDFKFFDLFQKAGIQLANKGARETTIFENIYEQGTRIQYIHARSETIFPEDLPEKWTTIPIVKFCLIADEVDFSFLKYFPDTLTAATIQGWLRKWNEEGRVSAKAMDWEQLRYIDIVFLSEDDISGFESILPKIQELVKILVVTKGEAGAIIYTEGQAFSYPAYPTKEIDPTGAGDIFAVSFLYKYHKTNSIREAIAFAHAAASLIVEKVGIQIPELPKIEKRYENYKANYFNC